MADLLFGAAIIAVLGGALWVLTRKRKNTNTGIVGGGSPLPQEPTNGGTVNPPKNGDDEF